jgi:AcrR family transcriptional regulator
MKHSTVPLETSAGLSARKGKTQERIIEAARELLKTEPYPDLTVEKILHRANVSRRTFYSYFSDKNEVARAVVTGIWQSAATLYASFAEIPVIDAASVRAWLQQFMLEWASEKDEISSLIPLMHEDHWHDTGAHARSNAAAMVGDGRHWSCDLQEARVRAYLLASQCDRAMSDFHSNRLNIGAEELLDVLTDAWILQLKPHVYG